jgi:O-antigen/teichoic acid export membrane protein
VLEVLVLTILIFVCALSFLGLFYTDPGTGALILQLLVAAFLGAVFYLRYFTKRARNLFSRKRQDEDNLEATTVSGVELPPTSSDSHEKDRVA